MILQRERYAHDRMNSFLVSCFDFRFGSRVHYFAPLVMNSTIR